MKTYLLLLIYCDECREIQDFLSLPNSRASSLGNFRTMLIRVSYSAGRFHLAMFANDLCINKALANV